MLSVQLQAVYDGPNPYADEPVLVAHLHCAGDASVLAGACVRLQQAFPAWLQEEEALSGNRPVLEYAAHTVVRWALAALNEVRGVLHSAGVAPVSAAATDTEIRLFLAFHQPQVSVQALELALRALLQAARPAPFSQADFLPALEKLWQMCRSHHPDYQARILMEGAAAMDLPVLPANGVARHWQFGWGARGRIFFESASNKDGMVAAQIARSKAATKAAFAASTPHCRRTSSMPLRWCLTRRCRMPYPGLPANSSSHSWTSRNSCPNDARACVQ